MTEQPTGEEPQGQRETEGSQEILDFEKYGALYGRFLLASLPGAKIDNIIDPDNKTVDFFNLTDDALKDKNYNPICEKFSLAERKGQWEGREFSDAYSEWQTKFTDYMKTKITAGSKREEALGIIMSDPKTKAAEFTKANADTLFNTFCKDTSNIDAFVKSVTTNLVKGGKIDPAYLKELLPHLQWIASGLFGKNTASQVVTRLIELESAVRNNVFIVLDIFNAKRINTPTDDERRVLGLLHPYLSKEEKRIPAQGIPVITADIPKPAPVTKSDEDEERARRAGPGVSSAEALREEMEAYDARRRQRQPMSSAAEELERELASLRELFAAPGPPPNVPKPEDNSQPIGENKEDSLIDQEINTLMTSIQQQAQALVSNEISAKGAFSISLKRQAEELKKTAQNLDELLTTHSQISPSEDFKKASSTILEKARSIAANVPVSKGAFPISSNRNLRDLNAAIKQVGEILAITPTAKSLPESTPEKSLLDMNLKELKAFRDKILSKLSTRKQDLFLFRALIMTETKISEMPTEERARVQDDEEEMIRMGIAHLQIILEKEGLSNAQPPAERTPEIKRIFEMGSKPFSLADRLFSGIPREARPDTVINFIRQAGGTI